MFLIPTIRRCAEFAESGKKSCKLDFKWIKPSGKEDKNVLNLSWSDEKPIPPETSIEEHVETELAALGGAHIIFPEITGIKIGERAKFGDRADYWIGDEGETLLEVSGLYKSKETAKTRVRKKEIQLKKSPYYNGEIARVDGYVSVTHFKNKKSILKYIPGI